MSTWWERYPDELSKEKAALEALGYAWSIDQAAMDAGQMVVRVDVPHEGGVLALTAVYPDTYPYFVPMVTTDSVQFQRHQHPLGRNLCLLAREGEDWRPGHDSLATLIREQLPAILGVNSGCMEPDAVAQAEDHAGEPLSSFLPYVPECSVIVPDETPPVEVPAGRLSLLLRSTPAGWPGQCFVNGIVESIADLQGKSLVRFNRRIPSFDRSTNGFWLRLNERPAVNTFESSAIDLYKLVDGRLAPLTKAIQNAKRGEVFIVGLLYPDEVSWRNNADDWVFLAIQVVRETKRSRPAEILPQIVRANWGGEKAWLRRAPFLAPLRTKTALVVGLGSLGSAVVVQLARAGIGGLCLLDDDNLHVGNTVRWALGWQYAGFQKGTALASDIAANYPYTIVQSFSHLRIGALPNPPAGQPSQYEILERLIIESDIVIDAAASYRVSHFLADLARERGKPYLWLTTTHGAAGGVVGRVQPSKNRGCWHCFQRGLADGSIHLPADAGTDEVQPGGCSQPTFIGAGIDSDVIANQAARLAAATLCSREDAGYPDFAWDVAVADLQRDGLSIAPEWTTHVLAARQDCPDCSGQA
ncbi:ThiF family adenylyltransferase [Burkholderia cenocepacia]|uniref:ThiF family adenylyltransferase n=1 Tax=Burkholderia cenocepacia TaxID=95486 RepID=UPI000413FFB9|nr:ThiF family adenylyltransferase [Burkholderia cenocepacia]